MQSGTVRVKISDIRIKVQAHDTNVVLFLLSIWKCKHCEIFFNFHDIILKLENQIEME